LGVFESRQSKLESQRVSIVISVLDTAAHCSFTIFLRVERIGVVFVVEAFGGFAEMSALLEVILADVHFGDDSLETDKLVSHSAVESSGGDKVGSEIAFDLDIVPVQFGGGLFLKIIALFLFLKELLDQDIILRGVLDDLLSRLRVKGPV
jgi:hypothetical protein